MGMSPTNDGYSEIQLALEMAMVDFGSSGGCPMGQTTYNLYDVALYLQNQYSKWLLYICMHFFQVHMYIYIEIHICIRICIRICIHICMYM